MAGVIRVRRPPPLGAGDPARINRTSGGQILNQVEICRVGYDDDTTDMPEATPAWIRWEQGEALVEITTRTGDQIVARLGLDNVDLEYGQQVVAVFPDGDPQDAVIVGRIHDSTFPVPSSAGGVLTGAAAATVKGARVPASTFRFTRLPDGRHLAIQTQLNGDIMIWSGASVHVKVGDTGAVHLDGAVHLGAAPVSPAVGSFVAPAGEEIPGAPAVPFVPVPYVPPEPPTPGVPVAPVAYAGNEDGVVRAKEIYQITVLSDPEFIGWMAEINSLAMNPNPSPVAVNVRISGVAGPGSKHTASDQDPPA